jgi:threonine dehydrogenase-like Zn-dependent dehydrogenase
MRAAVLVGPGHIELQEVETPRIGTGEVLVRLKYCGICTLEQRLFAGATRMSYPVIPGHEASGIVEEVGEGVLSPLRPGTPVALDLVIRCGECYFCRTGQSNLCQNRFNGDQRVLGGFAEYRAVSARQVFPVPPELPLAEAAFAEPVACCIRSLKKLALSLAEDLLIIGAGPMGIMHLLVARCLGARVFVSDPVASRRQMAAEMGACLTIDPAAGDLSAVIRAHTEGRGVDACVITSPAHPALRSASSAVSKGGRINIYTSYEDQPPLPVDADSVHRNETVITGSEGRTERDFHQAVRLLAFRMVQVTPLISLYAPFARIEEGIRQAIGAGTYRVLLDHEAVG